MKDEKDKPTPVQQAIAFGCLTSALMTFITFAFVVGVVVIFVNHLTK